MDNQLTHRKEQLTQQILRVSNRRARNDLLKMMKPVESALSNLDRESVECRRLNCTTSRYQDLDLAAKHMINTLEQYLTFACLIGD